MYIILFLIVISYRNICIKDQYTLIKTPHMTIYIYIYIYGDMRYNQIFLTDSRINISSHNKNFITAIYRRNLRNRLWSSLLPSSPLLYFIFYFFQKFFQKVSQQVGISTMHLGYSLPWGPEGGRRRPEDLSRANIDSWSTDCIAWRF